MTEDDIRSLYKITRKVGDCIDHAFSRLKNAIEHDRHHADVLDGDVSDDAGLIRLECTNQLRLLSGIIQSGEFRRIVDSCDWPIIRVIGGDGNVVSLAEAILRTSSQLGSSIHHVLTCERHRLGKAIAELEKLIEVPYDWSELADQLTTEQGRLVLWAQEHSRTVQREGQTYSPWIDSPKMIEMMKANGIRGTSDAAIKRTKKTWQAEAQTGSNNQRFRLKLSTLDVLSIKYPAEWNTSEA